MDAAFSDEAQLPGHLRLGQEAVAVGHVRKRTVAGEHLGFSGRQAQREQRGMHVARLTVDAVGRKQVAQPQLQSGHARVRAGQFSGDA